MSCKMLVSGVLAGAIGLGVSGPSPASAHGFAGARFFPATLVTDDPFVADELSLPTLSWSDDGEAGTTSYSFDIAKRITSNFGLEFAATYLQVHPSGGASNGPSSAGFDNFSLGAKYLLDVDAIHETIFSIGVDADLGGTGSRRVGADPFSTITPTVFFGKGFGDLADPTSLLRPFAITGSAGIGIPTQARGPDGAGGFDENPDTLQLGFALEYSLQYLQSQVRNIGLPAPFDKMTPLVELALQTPLNGGGPTTGTINPGVLWDGQYMQLGAEAIIPLDASSGKNVGFIAQMHFFIDDLFPDSIGRPLFGG